MGPVDMKHQNGLREDIPLVVIVALRLNSSEVVGAEEVGLVEVVETVLGVAMEVAVIMEEVDLEGGAGVVSEEDTRFIYFNDDR
ncbi:hypothetical protein NQ317_003747, partial [Molorchus minor]